MSDSNSLTPGPQDEEPPQARSESRRAASRAQAFKRVLTPTQWQDSLAVTTLASPSIMAIAGFQAALAVCLALVLTHLSPWPHLLGYAALGGLAALFGRYASVSERRYIVAISGLLLTLAVAIPATCAYLQLPTTALIVVLALISAGSIVAVSHWRLGSPGAVIILFAAGAAIAPIAD